MTTFRIIHFESLVRDYIALKKQWDGFHNFLIEAEWKGETDLPLGSNAALKDLCSTFLANSKDDPHFLLSKAEIRGLLDSLDADHRQ